MGFRAEETLEWARGRVADLLADLDDEELLGLLRDGATSPQSEACRGPHPGGHPEPSAAPDPAPKPKLKLPRRREVRYALRHPVEIRTGSWTDFIELVTQDISRGGMFVQSDVLPEVRSQVIVRVRLPDGAGKLRLDAEVVHVMTADAAADGAVAGFGLQFGEMTAERRFMLDQLVKHAHSLEDSADPIAERVVEELGLQHASASGVGLRLTLSEAELRQIKKVRAELAAMRERSDAELLGVSEEAVPAQVRDAFERVQAKWGSLTEGARVPTELRAAAEEIRSHLEDARERLLLVAQSVPAPAPPPAPPVQATPVPRQGSTPKPRRGPPPPRSAPAVPVPLMPDPTPVPVSTTPAPAPEPGAPVQRLWDPTPIPDDPMARRGPGQATVKNARRFLDRLAPKKNPPKPSRFLKPSQPRGNQLLGKAYEFLSNRQYDAAEEVLCKALQLDVQNHKAQLLLHFVRARKAVAKRDFATAKRLYEALLRSDPDNESAKKELLMISALA